MGILIGLPAAGLTLVLCRYLDRILNVPMRPYGSEPEPEPLADDKLPPLWLALLPIVLPILLIAANTVSKTLAEAEHIRYYAPNGKYSHNLLAFHIRRLGGMTKRLSKIT